VARIRLQSKQQVIERTSLIHVRFASVLAERVGTRSHTTDTTTDTRPLKRGQGPQSSAVGESHVFYPVFLCSRVIVLLFLVSFDLLFCSHLGRPPKTADGGGGRHDFGISIIKLD
jgi:hypothetical protein